MRTATAIDLQESVSEEIRALMARRRVSQSQLGRMVGEVPSWVSRRLSGDTPMTLRDFQRIASALGAQPNELLGENSSTAYYNKDAA